MNPQYTATFTLCQKSDYSLHLSDWTRCYFFADFSHLGGVSLSRELGRDLGKLL